jgi:hypothetical protein
VKSTTFSPIARKGIGTTVLFKVESQYSIKAVFFKKSFTLPSHYLTALPRMWMLCDPPTVIKGRRSLQAKVISSNVSFAANLKYTFSITWKRDGSCNTYVFVFVVFVCSIETAAILTGWLLSMLQIMNHFPPNFRNFKG